MAHLRSNSFPGSLTSIISDTWQTAFAHYLVISQFEYQSLGESLWWSQKATLYRLKYSSSLKEGNALPCNVTQWMSCFVVPCGVRELILSCGRSLCCAVKSLNIKSAKCVLVSMAGMPHKHLFILSKHFTTTQHQAKHRTQMIRQTENKKRKILKQRWHDSSLSLVGDPGELHGAMWIGQQTKQNEIESGLTGWYRKGCAFGMNVIGQVSLCSPLSMVLHLRRQHRGVDGYMRKHCSRWPK